MAEAEIVAEFMCKRDGELVQSFLGRDVGKEIVELTGENHCEIVAIEIPNVRRTGETEQRIRAETEQITKWDASAGEALFQQRTRA